MGRSVLFFKDIEFCRFSSFALLQKKYSSINYDFFAVPQFGRFGLVMLTPSLVSNTQQQTENRKINVLFLQIIKTDWIVCDELLPPGRNSLKY